MKKIIFLQFVICLLTTFISCSRKGLSAEDTQSNNVSVGVKHDTIYIVDEFRVDSLKTVLLLTQDSLCIARDSMIFYRDTILYENYINARRVEKVKYYISICEKNSANKKFFFGWIKRAVSE